MTHVDKGAVIAGRYRLDRLLGEGGMGAVWAATHTVTGKSVAVKFLKGELAANVALVGRFIREARAACAVRHPNVVQIHDVLTLDSGAPAMVMDLLEGESLGAKLSRERRLTVPDFARTMAPVLSAVAAAHAASIVHRDLKPDNLFLARNADGGIDVKVLDFGIAKINAPDQEGGQLTKTGSMLGTPFYMSPEQLFGEKDIDGRSDVWSLGIIFYECLSGVLPTQAENLGQIIKMVTTTGFPPLVSVASHVPPEISGIVEQMLLRDRASRASDLMAIREVLLRYAGVSGYPLASPMIAAGPALATHGTAAANTPTESAPPPSEPRPLSPLQPRPAAPATEAPWGSTRAQPPRTRSAVPAVVVGVTALVAGAIGIVAVPKLRAGSSVPTASSSPLPPASESASSIGAADSAEGAPAPLEASAPFADAAPPASVAAEEPPGPAKRAAPTTVVPASKPVASSSSAKPAASSPPQSRPTPAGQLEEKVPF